MAKRDAVFPAGRQALYEINRYSAAIRSGDLLFVSGQVGSREDESPEPVFEQQVRLAFDNLAAVLWRRPAARPTTSWTYPPSTPTRPRSSRRSTPFGWRRSAARPNPNWTAVGVNWLAGFDFEIKVIARLP